MSYYEDEFDYDDLYPEPQIEGMTLNYKIHKAKNGHLAWIEVQCIRWTGQDWGQCDVHIHWGNLNDLRDEYLANAIELGKQMQPGTTEEWRWVICPECGRKALDGSDYCFFHVGI
jgi:hypothetical protein